MRALSLPRPQMNGTLCLNKIFTDSTSLYCSVSKILFKAFYFSGKSVHISHIQV